MHSQIKNSLISGVWESNKFSDIHTKRRKWFDLELGKLHVCLAQYFNAAFSFLFKMFYFYFENRCDWVIQSPCVCVCVWERERINRPIAKHKPNVWSTLRWEIDKIFALSITFMLSTIVICQRQNEKKKNKFCSPKNILFWQFKDLNGINQFKSKSLNILFCPFKVSI